MSDNINNMDFKQLRNEVQSLRDELAIMKRKYEDVIYNIDTDNFSQRVVKQGKDMYSKIEQNAEGISLQAEKVEENKQSLAKLQVTAGEIRTEVQNVDGKLNNYSTIEQTAKAIKSHAYASADLSLAEKITDIEYATDPTKTYCVLSNNGTKTYYYYNTISKEWEEIKGGGIDTVFEQTATGFKLKGNVLIDGDTVVTENLKLSGVVTWDMTNSPVKTEYSSDGVLWHPNQTVSDMYIRFSFDGGKTWSDATQIVGRDGADGDDGDDADVPSYIQTTYIDSTKILSPDIWGGKFYATGKGANGGAAYYIYDGYYQKNGVVTPGDLLGYISYDDNGAGTAEEAKERVFFTTQSGIALKLQAGGNMSLEAKGGTIHFMSDVEFHGATNIGSGEGGIPYAVFK